MSRSGSSPLTDLSIARKANNASPLPQNLSRSCENTGSSSGLRALASKVLTSAGGTAPVPAAAAVADRTALERIRERAIAAGILRAGRPRPAGAAPPPPSFGPATAAKVAGTIATSATTAVPEPAATASNPAPVMAATTTSSLRRAALGSNAGCGPRNTISNSASAGATAPTPAVAIAAAAAGVGDGNPRALLVSPAASASMMSATTTATTVSDRVPRSSSTLLVQVCLPQPPPLHPVSSMTPHDIIRELVAVSCQRDAETGAALAVFDECAASAAGLVPWTAAAAAVTGLREMAAVTAAATVPSAAASAAVAAAEAASARRQLMFHDGAGDAAAAGAVAATGSAQLVYHGGGGGGSRSAHKKSDGASAAPAATSQSLLGALPTSKSQTEGTAAAIDGRAIEPAAASTSAAASAALVGPTSAAAVVGSFVVEARPWAAAAAAATRERRGYSNSSSNDNAAAAGPLPSMSLLPVAAQRSGGIVLRVTTQADARNAADAAAPHGSGGGAVVSAAPAASAAVVSSGGVSDGALAAGSHIARALLTNSCTAAHPANGSTTPISSTAAVVRLSVLLAPGVQPSTLAYALPAQRVLPNMPSVGTAPAHGALAAVRHLLATHLIDADAEAEAGTASSQVEGAGGSGAGTASAVRLNLPSAAGARGSSSSSAAAATGAYPSSSFSSFSLACTSDDNGEGRAAAASATQSPATAAASPALHVSSYCRAWPHALLTPAQSQIRVQSLVAELRVLMGYDYTPPPPPLAPTRLGTSHNTSPLGFDPISGNAHVAVPSGDHTSGSGGTNFNLGQQQQQRAIDPSGGANNFNLGDGDADHAGRWCGAEDERRMTPHGSSSGAASSRGGEAHPLSTSGAYSAPSFDAPSSTRLVSSSALSTASSSTVTSTSSQQLLLSSEELEDEFYGVFRGTVTIKEAPAAAAVIVGGSAPLLPLDASAALQLQASHLKTPSKATTLLSQGGKRAGAGAAKQHGSSSSVAVTPLVLQSATRRRPTVTFHFASPSTSTSRLSHRAQQQQQRSGGGTALLQLSSPLLLNSASKGSLTAVASAHKSNKKGSRGYGAAQVEVGEGWPGDDGSSPRPGSAYWSSSSSSSSSSSRSNATIPLPASAARSTASSTAADAASGGSRSAGPPPVLARYVDATLDFTRGGVSPATFHRGDHAGVLSVLETGLAAMQAQRRAEEEHMRRATGVRPSKHPRGGYWYHDVENPSIEVPFHEYERRYLEEVANATRFIDSVTARAWADEAAAEAAASSVQSRAAAAEVDAVCAAARVSWWTQDIEDGMCSAGLPVWTETTATATSIVSGGPRVGAKETMTTTAAATGPSAHAAVAAVTASSASTAAGAGGASNPVIAAIRRRAAAGRPCTQVEDGRPATQVEVEADIAADDGSMNIGAALQRIVLHWMGEQAAAAAEAATAAEQRILVAAAAAEAAAAAAAAEACCITSELQVDVDGVGPSLGCELLQLADDEYSPTVRITAAASAAAAEQQQKWDSSSSGVLQLAGEKGAVAGEEEEDSSAGSSTAAAAPTSADALGLPLCAPVHQQQGKPLQLAPQSFSLRPDGELVYSSGSVGPQLQLEQAMTGWATTESQLQLQPTLADVISDAMAALNAAAAAAPTSTSAAASTALNAAAEADTAAVEASGCPFSGIAVQLMPAPSDNDSDDESTFDDDDEDEEGDDEEEEEGGAVDDADEADEFADVAEGGNFNFSTGREVRNGYVAIGLLSAPQRSLTPKLKGEKPVVVNEADDDIDDEGAAEEEEARRGPSCWSATPAAAAAAAADVSNGPSTSTSVLAPHLHPHEEAEQCADGCTGNTEAPSSTCAVAALESALGVLSLTELQVEVDELQLVERTPLKGTVSYKGSAPGALRECNFNLGLEGNFNLPHGPSLVGDQRLAENTENVATLPTIAPSAAAARTGALQHQHSVTAQQQCDAHWQQQQQQRRHTTTEGVFEGADDDQDPQTAPTPSVCGDHSECCYSEEKISTCPDGESNMALDDDASASTTTAVSMLSFCGVTLESPAPAGPHQVEVGTPAAAVSVSAVTGASASAAGASRSSGGAGAGASGSGLVVTWKRASLPPPSKLKFVGRSEIQLQQQQCTPPAPSSSAVVSPTTSSLAAVAVAPRSAGGADTQTSSGAVTTASTASTVSVTSSTASGTTPTASGTTSTASVTADWTPGVGLFTPGPDFKLKSTSTAGTSSGSSPRVTVGSLMRVRRIVEVELCPTSISSSSSGGRHHPSPLSQSAGSSSSVVVATSAEGSRLVGRPGWAPNSTSTAEGPEWVECAAAPRSEVEVGRASTEVKEEEEGCAVARGAAADNGVEWVTIPLAQ